MHLFSFISISLLIFTFYPILFAENLTPIKVTDQDKDLDDNVEKRPYMPFEELPFKLPYQNIIIGSRATQINDKSIDLGPESELVKILQEARKPIYEKDVNGKDVNINNPYKIHDKFRKIINEREKEIVKDLNNDSVLGQLIRFLKGYTDRINFASDELDKIINQWKCSNTGNNSFKRESFLGKLIDYAEYCIKNEFWYEACAMMQYYDTFAMTSVGQPVFNVQNKTFFDQKTKVLTELIEKINVNFKKITPAVTLMTLSKSVPVPFPNIFTVPFTREAGDLSPVLLVHLNVKFRYTLMIRLLMNRWKNIKEEEAKQSLTPPILTIDTESLLKKEGESSPVKPLIWEELLVKYGLGYDIRPMCLQAIDVLYFNAIGGLINDKLTNSLLDTHCKGKEFEGDRMEIKLLLEAMATTTKCEQKLISFSSLSVEERKCKPSKDGKCEGDEKVKCKFNDNKECEQVNPTKSCFIPLIRKVSHEISKLENPRRSMKLYALMARLITSAFTKVPQDPSSQKTATTGSSSGSNPPPRLAGTLSKIQWLSVLSLIKKSPTSVNPGEYIVIIHNIANLFLNNKDYVEALWAFEMYNYPRSVNDYGDSRRNLNMAKKQIMHAIEESKIFGTETTKGKIKGKEPPKPLIQTDKSIEDYVTDIIKNGKSNLLPKETRGFKPGEKYHDRMKEMITKDKLPLKTLAAFYSDLKITLDESEIPKVDPSSSSTLEPKKSKWTQKKRELDTKTIRVTLKDMNTMKREIMGNQKYNAFELYPDGNMDCSDLLDDSLQYSVSDTAIGVSPDSKLGILLNSASIAASEGRVYHTLSLLYEFDQFSYSSLYEGRDAINGILLNQELEIINKLIEKVEMRFPDLKGIRSVAMGGGGTVSISLQSQISRVGAAFKPPLLLPEAAGIGKPSTIKAQLQSTKAPGSKQSKIFPNLGLFSILQEPKLRTLYLTYEKEKLLLLERMIKEGRYLIVGSFNDEMSINIDDLSNIAFSYLGWMRENNLGFDPRPLCFQACEVVMLNARAGLHDRDRDFKEIEKYCKGNDFFSWKIAEAKAYIALKEFEKEGKNEKEKEKEKGKDSIQNQENSQKEISDCCNKFKNIMCHAFFVEFKKNLKTNPTIEGEKEKEPKERFKQRELYQIELTRVFLNDFAKLELTHSRSHSKDPKDPGVMYFDQFSQLDESSRLKLKSAFYGTRSSVDQENRRLNLITLQRQIALEDYEKFCVGKKNAQRPIFKRLLDPMNICSFDTQEYIPSMRLSDEIDTAIETIQKNNNDKLPLSSHLDPKMINLIKEGNVDFWKKLKRMNSTLASRILTDNLILVNKERLSDFYIENVNTIKELLMFDSIVRNNSRISLQIIQCKINSVITEEISKKITNNDEIEHVSEMIKKLASNPLKELLLERITEELCKILSDKKLELLEIKEKRERIRTLYNLVSVYIPIVK